MVPSNRTAFQTRNSVSIFYQTTRVRSPDYNLYLIYYRPLVFHVFDLSAIHQHMSLLFDLSETHFDLLGHLRGLPVSTDHIYATADAHTSVSTVLRARVTKV